MRQPIHVQASHIPSSYIQEFRLHCFTFAHKDHVWILKPKSVVFQCSTRFSVSAQNRRTAHPALNPGLNAGGKSLEKDLGGRVHSYKKLLNISRARLMTGDEK